MLKNERQKKQKRSIETPGVVGILPTAMTEAELQQQEREMSRLKDRFEELERVAARNAADLEFLSGLMRQLEEAKMGGTLPRLNSRVN